MVRKFSLKVGKNGRTAGYASLDLNKVHLGNRKTGFTLIEIMVAVFIMVVATSFLVANLGISDGKILRLEARKIAAIINHGSDEAILTGQLMGLQFDTSKNSYQIVNVGNSANEGNEKDGFMRTRNSSENISADLNLLEREKKPSNQGVELKMLEELFNSSILDKAPNVFDDDSVALNQTIILEPNGLIAPFRLTLQSGKESISIELGDLGNAIVVDPKNKNE